MKIFLDTAETDVVRKHFKTGLIDGLTTNPSLIRKSGRKHEEVYQEFKEIGLTDISMEVIGNADNMISEGKRLHKKFGKVATIKVPCTVDVLLACKELSDSGIRVNVTLIFSPDQAILSAKQVLLMCLHSYDVWMITHLVVYALLKTLLMCMPSRIGQALKYLLHLLEM